MKTNMMSVKLERVFVQRMKIQAAKKGVPMYSLIQGFAAHGEAQVLLDKRKSNAR